MRQSINDNRHHEMKGILWSTIAYRKDQFFLLSISIIMYSFSHLLKFFLIHNICYDISSHFIFLSIFFGKLKSLQNESKKQNRNSLFLKICSVFVGPCCYSVVFFEENENQEPWLIERNHPKVKNAFSRICVHFVLQNKKLRSSIKVCLKDTENILVLCKGESLCKELRVNL